MFIKNITEGHAKDVVQHGAANGIDALRTLFRDQLPLADDKRNVLMTESMELKEPTNAQGLRQIMVDVGRIADNCKQAI